MRYGLAASDLADDRQRLRSEVSGSIREVDYELYGDSSSTYGMRDPATGWWFKILRARLNSIWTQAATGDVASLTRRLARINALIALGRGPAYVLSGVAVLGVLGGIGYGGYRVVKKMRKKR